MTPRHDLASGALLAAAALAAGLSLLACSSGEPTNPAADPGADPNTYVLATVTLLDRNEPCDPGVDCEPEFYDCATQAAYLVGETWTVRGDLVTAGLSNAGASSVTVAISATDVVEQTGVAIEFLIPDVFDPSAGLSFRGNNPSDCTRPTLEVEGTFTDVFALCARLNDNAVQESRFTLDTCEAQSITLTSWETDGTGALQLAQSAGGNEFSPTGIIEGTFSFIGKNLQSTPGGDIQAWVQVDGCFRVNLPILERGVPSNPTPPSALCAP